MNLFRSSFVHVPALAAALVGLAGCVHHDSGPITTQTRSPAAGASTVVAPASGAFSRVDVRGAIDVVVREAATTSVSVTGSPSTQARVQTRVEGDTLVVDLDGDDEGSSCFGLCINSGDRAAKVDVSMPAFHEGTIEGSGDLTVETTGAHPEIVFDVRGSGDVHYHGDADTLRCTIDGSGDVTLRGSGKRLEARVHGSGDVRAKEFPVEGGLYEIDGSGDIATIVHGGDMTVHINGSGDLVYGGQARITSLDVSGSGAVRQLGSRED
jgi:hypothetical protein